MIRAVLPGFSASKPRLRVTEQYFAFYWTLPVPWAGFIRLPDGVDEAAQVSRTIRYQRDRIRQHIRIQRAEMAPGGEMVRLELAPDRGSAEIAADFGRLLNRAMAENAMVAIIDFASHAGWRRHSHLVRHYQHPCCDRIEITPGEAQLAGFNPYRHFEDWRDRMLANIAAKPDHRTAILSALEEMEYLTLPARAAALNSLGLKTHGGKDWTADNLRKFAQAADHG